MKRIISIFTAIFIGLTLTLSVYAAGAKNQGSDSKNQTDGQTTVTTTESTVTETTTNTNTTVNTSKKSKDEINALKEQMKANQMNKVERKAILNKIVELRKKNGDKSIPIIVNGEVVTFDVPPVIKQNRTLIPVRAVTKALGADVKWDAKTPNIVTITKTITDEAGKETSIVIVIDLATKVITKNGEVVKLDVPPQVVSNRTMVPIRFIAEAFGMKVESDKGTGGVFVDDEDSSTGTTTTGTTTDTTTTGSTTGTTTTGSTTGTTTTGTTTDTTTNTTTDNTTTANNTTDPTNPTTTTTP